MIKRVSLIGVLGILLIGCLAMSTTATGTVKYNADIVAVNDRFKLAESTSNISVNQTNSFSLGSGDMQINLHYVAEYDIPPGGVTINLQSLTNEFGDSISFSAVRYIWISNVRGSGYIEMRLSGANPWTNFMLGSSAIYITKGGTMQFLAPYAGYEVTATNKTFDLLDPGGLGVTARVVILGS